MIEKLWGRSHAIWMDHCVQVAKCEIRRGGYSSRHFHRWKDNVFIVESGEMVVRMYHGPDGRGIGDHYTDFQLDPTSEPFTVHAGQHHRFIAGDDTLLVELYRANGDRKVSPDDIVRCDAGGVLVEGQQLV